MVGLLGVNWLIREALNSGHALNLKVTISSTHIAIGPRIKLFLLI